MNLTTLNSPTIANAGAGLITLAITGFGADFATMMKGTVPAWPALVAPFAIVALGGMLAYIGRPTENLVPK